MSSMLRTMKRAIEREKFKKENGFSLSKHKKNDIKIYTIKAFKTNQKEKKQSKTAFFDKLKSVLRRKERHGRD